jgi:hypothetical protein
MSKDLSRILLFCIVFGLAISLIAADAWMAKDYKQWDGKDVSKILNDSPWAKTIVVAKNWTSGPPGASPKSNSNYSQADMPTATFIVRWISSGTIHRAVARDSVLNRNGALADPDKYASEIPETYDVAVLGEDLAVFGPLDGDAAIEQLRQKVYLENKAASLHVTPLKVVVSMKPDGKTPSAVTFNFPKKNADGSPLFAPNLNGVDFIFPSVKAEIKTHFDFTKMKTQQGLDL